MVLSEKRQLVVDEALTWLRTPYHHQARVKGAGVDCVWLLIKVYQKAGVVAEDFDPGNYSAEWYMHRSEEIYLTGVLSHAKKVDKPQPGDVALYSFGRCVSHGVIVVGENGNEIMGVHANRASNNVELIELRALADKFHSYWSALP